MCGKIKSSLNIRRKKLLSSISKSIRNKYNYDIEYNDD